MHTFDTVKNADVSSHYMPARKRLFNRVQQKQELANILSWKSVQAKLKVGQANDRYEQEADRVSNQVLNMSNTDVAQRVEEGRVQPMSIQRMCKECIDENAKPGPGEVDDEQLQAKFFNGSIQRKSQDNSGLSNATESKINNLRGGGKPLEPSVRQFFEPRFGHDFSQVRVHTDTNAADSAASINAKAFTLGHDLVFASGQYNPHSQEGKRLLGHELTHVIQQNGGDKIQKQPQQNVIQRVNCSRGSTTIADFPNTYIEHIDVNLTNPCQVTLRWTGPNASSQQTGPFNGTPGNGGGRYNCDDTAISNTPGSNCTPKGDFTIERQACSLSAYPAAKNASYFQSSRGVAFHYWSSRPNCPASHGCVRLSEAASAIIWDNSINQNTAPTHGQAATTVHVGGTWSPCP